jgi:hypothetical protein
MSEDSDRNGPGAFDVPPFPDAHEETPPEDPFDQTRRRLVLTPASDIKIRRVAWLWEGRIALGTLALLAGPEGLGKSTLASWLIARITNGDLPGEHLDQPRAALICASEDSWEHTIVPRLMAAGAKLDLVYRVEVRSADEIAVGLSLPRDLIALEAAAKETGASLLVLDPLMSRIAEGLDTHKDSEVRRALEPLTTIADRANLAILGLIHHNKSGSADPLQLVMASKAFTAVARSVHTVIADPDDEDSQRRLFGTPKNNLGRGNLPTLAFTLVGHAIPTDDGPAWTGRLDWNGEVDGTIAEAMRRSATDPDDRSATTEAGTWLLDYLHDKGSTAASGEIKKHGAAAGHSYDALKRARRRHKITYESTGYPRITYWSLPGTQPQSEQQSEQTPRGDAPTALTAPTEGKQPQSAQSAQSAQDTRTPPPTDAPTDRKSA